MSHIRYGATLVTLVPTMVVKAHLTYTLTYKGRDVASAAKAQGKFG